MKVCIRVCLCVYTYINIYIYIYICILMLSGNGPLPPLGVPRTPYVPHPSVRLGVLPLHGLAVPHFRPPPHSLWYPTSAHGGGGSCSFGGADDQDNDDSDDVEHDVKDDPIVDSRRCLEQHNVMSSITGATARRKIKSNT